MNDLEALSHLAATPLLGSVRVRQLINYFGSASNALEANSSDLAHLQGFGPKTLLCWDKWRVSDSWKSNLDLADQMGVDVIPYTSEKYPKALLEISDFPLLLYVKGELLPEDHQSVAVVGTRAATIYGLEMAESISYDLASMGFTVVSGLARGVDTQAHQGALKAGRTIAVIGSGLANIYPRENKKLADEISQSGAMVSEFPMNTPPDRQNFPQRNRIVSGMTKGTLLIEAPEKSGAMITMRKAQSQKKRLFAIPGRCDQENFKGNHLLIREGVAELVENGRQIGSAFNSFLGLINSRKTTNNLNPPLEKEELEFLENIPNEELNIDQLVNHTKLPVSKINVLLMGLLIKDLVKEYPGKIYKKVNCYG